MIWAENSVMRQVMEYCDENCHGTLCRQGSWMSLVREAMEICDGMVMEHCDDKNSGEL